MKSAMGCNTEIPAAPIALPAGPIPPMRKAAESHSAARWYTAGFK